MAGWRLAASFVRLSLPSLTLTAPLSELRRCAVPVERGAWSVERGASGLRSAVCGPSVCNTTNGEWPRRAVSHPPVTTELLSLETRSVMLCDAAETAAPSSRGRNLKDGKRLCATCDFVICNAAILSKLLKFCG